MRPTRKSLIVASLAGMLFIAGATAQAGWLFVLASLLLGGLVFSLFARHPLRGLQIRRQSPRRIAVGSEAPVSLIVENHGRLASPIARLTDSFGAFPETSYLLEPVPRGSSVLVAPSLSAYRRGIYSEGEVRIETGAPFGLKHSKRVQEVATQVTVVPNWVQLRSFPLLEPASFPKERLHERARVGTSDELFGTREYRRGDPFRSIHWKSSAHAGHLIVREYQQEVAGRVVISIWGRETGEAPDSDLEMLVSSAASIGNYALHAGHRVDLVFPRAGEPTVLPALDLDSLLDGLAAVEAATDDLGSCVDLVLSRAGRRGTVVLHATTTGLTSGDLRQAIRRIEMAGNRVIVVLADSSSWDEKASGVERDDLRSTARVSRILTRNQDLRACLEAS